jgi:hypothetical protein
MTATRPWPGPASWAIALAALTGLAFSAAAAWPGLLSEDSMVQYQAALRGSYADWHPPLMSWVWRQGLRVLPGSQSMLLLQLAMLWAGLWLFCRAARPHRLAPLLLLPGLAPWVLNFSGVIWKDCAMAFALLAAAGLLLRPPGSPGAAALLVRNMAVLVLLFYALNLRHNAVFAIAPLLWWLLRSTWPQAPRWRPLAGAGGVLLALLVLSQLLQYQVLQAQRQRPGNVALVDDLAHLSLVERRSLIPGIELHHIHACAGRDIVGTKLLNRYACFLQLAPEVTAPAVRADLLPAWRRAVAAHPWSYLRFRLAAFAFLLRAPDLPPAFERVGGTAANDLGFSYQPNAAGLWTQRALVATVQAWPGLFKPYAWLCVAIGLLALSLVRARGAAATPERVLLLSALGYTLGYLPVTPLSDFRYVYWSVLATSVAALWMLLRPRIESPAALQPRRVAMVLVLAACAMAAVASIHRWAGLNADALLRAQLPAGQGLAATRLRDLAAVDGRLRMQGPAPRFEADGLALDIGAVKYLSFALQCEGSGKLLLQVRTWGDAQPGPEAGHVVDFVAEPGINVIAFDTYRPWPRVSTLNGLQIDLPAAPTLCRTLTISDIQLHG